MKTPATLASVTSGDAVRIEHVLFGALRALCEDLGLREGDEVRCRAGTAGVIVVETASGGVIAVARDWARYISVSGTAPAC
jgi:hypothetical protein